MYKREVPSAPQGGRHSNRAQTPQLEVICFSCKNAGEKKINNTMRTRKTLFTLTQQAVIRPAEIRK